MKMKNMALALSTISLIGLTHCGMPPSSRTETYPQAPSDNPAPEDSDADSQGADSTNNTETNTETNEDSQNETSPWDPSSCRGVADEAAGLCWQDPTYFGPNEAGITWADGIRYCEQLVIDGIDGWRMPNVDEIRTMISGCPSTESEGACTIMDGCPDTSFSAACDGCTQFQGPTGGCYWGGQFSGPCPGNVWMWSSSESVDPGLPFFFDPSVGRLGRTFDVFPMAVRCVR